MKKKISRSYGFGNPPLHHLAPVVVWLAVLAFVVGLLYRRSHRFEIVGIARSQIHQVAATCTGRLKSVPVQLFEQVQVGQTLAVVNTILDNEQLVKAELETQLAAATAEIEHLAAQLVPAQDTLLAEKGDREINRDRGLRGFFIDVDQARLQILTLQAQIATDRIVLGDLAVEMKINQDLVAKDAVAPYELEKAKVAHDSLAAKIEQYERTLEQAKRDLEQAQQRLDDFLKRQLEHPSVDDALEVIRKEIRVQEQVMRGLLTQLETLESREALELKSPVNGVVIPIPVPANEAMSHRPGEKEVLQPGEVVTAGDSILAVAEMPPAEVVAYVGEQYIGQVQEKMAVELIKDRKREQKARSEVAHVGPVVELMPQRLWRNPAIPQWGRPIVIKVPDGFELIPGELVGVRAL